MDAPAGNEGRQVAMNEVRFHARKGQGAVEAAKIIAGAMRLAGRDASWHVPFEWEGGVNFEAGVAMAEGPKLEALTALVAFYPPLIEMPDVWMGFENPSIVLINTRSFLVGDNLPENIGLAAVDATGIARSVGGYSGIPNLVAPMLGALSAVTGVVLGARLVDALHEAARALKMNGNELARAIHALELGYDGACITRGRQALHCGDPDIEKLLFAS